MSISYKCPVCHREISTEVYSFVRIATNGVVYLATCCICLAKTKVRLDSVETLESKTLKEKCIDKICNN